MLHLLFHPAHFHRDEVADAMSTAIRRGKQEGLEWWTARQLNAWERARRKIRLTEFAEKSVTLASDEPLEDATILRLAPNKSVGDFTAYGFNFAAIISRIAGAARMDV